MRTFSGPVLRGYGSLRSEEEGKKVSVYENRFRGERRGVLAFYCGSPAFPVCLLEFPQGLCTAAQGRVPEVTLGCGAGLLGTHLSVVGHWVGAGSQVLGPAVPAELGHAVPCL